MWSQETAFALTEHTENGRQTPLIKDWKDLTTQVSDLQSLLGSLKASPFFGAFADTVSHTGFTFPITCVSFCFL